MNDCELSQLDIFYGEMTVNRAYIYARMPRSAGDVKLVGQVQGPRCLNSRTLPITANFVDLGPGPTLLARASLPEPCFWSSDLPAIYDVIVTVREGLALSPTTARREIGLRSLGVREQHLVLQGKRWVMRGVTAASANVMLPREWHAASAAFVVDEIDARLAEASQRGALAVVEVSGNPSEIVARLRHLSMFPAVATAVIRGEVPRQLALTGIAPNLLLAQTVTNYREFVAHSWAQAIWAETNNQQALARLFAASDRPIIAVRRLSAPRPIEQARAACDELQRDLACIGQFAGYVV